MRGRKSECTKAPAGASITSEMVSYSLTRAGRAALAAAMREAEARQDERAALARQLRAAGQRCGTVSSRWQHETRVPELRLSGQWLQEAGFDQGQTFSIGVEAGRLVIAVVASEQSMAIGSSA